MMGEEKDEGSLERQIHPTSNRAFLKPGYMGVAVSSLWLFGEPRCPSEATSGS